MQLNAIAKCWRIEMSAQLACEGYDLATLLTFAAAGHQNARQHRGQRGVRTPLACEGSRCDF